MIIEIFLLFTALAFIFSIVGYYIGNELMLILGVLGFMFMAFPLIGQDLEFRDGANITSSYSYDGSYLNTTTNLIEYNYVTYTDTLWYGVFFIFISLSGLFILYRGYRKSKDDEMD